MSSQENGQVPVEIKLIVYGDSVAQGRPKATGQGGHIRVYDPVKSRNYKEVVRTEALKLRLEKLLCGELEVTVNIYRSVPKSFSKKNNAMALREDIRPITKPDVSNIVKGIEDALNGILWRDDSQIVDLHVSKFYSEIPRVEVFITETRR